MEGVEAPDPNEPCVETTAPSNCLVLEPEGRSRVAEAVMLLWSPGQHESIQLLELYYPGMLQLSMYSNAGRATVTV